jgi:hypothetical protein
VWLELLFAGLRSLQDYVATHVLTCLVPAFLLAGALVAFVDREAVLDHLGAHANKTQSFSVASGASFLLAACSCTVIPVASGLYFAGAGIGVAFIVLWVAPAANILALLYTGSILGAQMVILRVAAALLMAFVVGWVMTLAFERRPAADAPAPTATTRRIMGRRELGLLGLILLSLLVPNYLGAGVSYGQKVGVWALLTALVAGYALALFRREALLGWLRETWWFVRIILPLLLAGVFLVGVIGTLLPEPWIRDWLGGNSLRASFLATVIGSVSYFATMTEAPFVDTLLKLGMGKGPALALLLTGPGLSLPNWLAIARVFGPAKALVYVPTLMVLGTLVGWVSGNLFF